MTWRMRGLTLVAGSAMCLSAWAWAGPGDGAGGAVGDAVEPVVRYDGHKAVRVFVATPRELLMVHAIAADILTCEGSGIGPFDVRVSPEGYAALVATGVRHEVLVPDIQARVDAIWAEDARIRAAQAHEDDPSWFVTYRSLAEIEAKMQQFANDYPNLATLSQVGTSVQGRPIRMLRITGPGSTASRPAFIVQANQHAREWLTPMSAMYIIDRLLETYSTDARVRNVVDNIDFYIVPSVNPDGYEYSRTVNSQWRKNRRDNPGTSCDGIDLNRNWGFQWGFDNTGSSPNPCSETYRGPSAFSEPEILGLKALSDSLKQQNRLKVHWDIHANARMILSPWGYTTQAPPDLALMNTLGAIIQTGMRTVRNQSYPYGQGSVILYLNNGNTRDYSYGVNGAQSWTIELSGNSFQPPVGEILPNCQEALAGLLPLAEYYIVPGQCYANCDGSTGAPSLTPADFVCFLNRYRAGDSYANCDGSTGTPSLTPADFVCFINAFRGGC